MARLLFAVILLAATVLQALIYPQLFTIRVFPNFVLVFLLCWSAVSESQNDVQSCRLHSMLSFATYEMWRCRITSDRSCPAMR